MVGLTNQLGNLFCGGDTSPWLALLAEAQAAGSCSGRKSIGFINANLALTGGVLLVHSSLGVMGSSWWCILALPRLL